MLLDGHLLRHLLRLRRCLLKGLSSLLDLDTWVSLLHWLLDDTDLLLELIHLLELSLLHLVLLELLLHLLLHVDHLLHLLRLLLRLLLVDGLLLLGLLELRLLLLLSFSLLIGFNLGKALRSDGTTDSSALIHMNKQRLIVHSIESQILLLRLLLDWLHLLRLGLLDKLSLRSHLLLLELLLRLSWLLLGLGLLGDLAWYLLLDLVDKLGLLGSKLLLGLHLLRLLHEHLSLLLLRLWLC